MTASCPIETERKFLIRMPAIDALRAMPDYEESAIEQIYLRAPTGRTHRIRRRVYDGRTVCTETVKQRINAMQAYEDEHEISEADFEEKRALRDVSRHVVFKNRHTFIYKKQLFEVDIYPFWAHQCVVETELSDPNEQPPWPPCLALLREVSGDRAYSNAALSKCIPPEDEEAK